VQKEVSGDTTCLSSAVIPHKLLTSRTFCFGANFVVDFLDRCGFCGKTELCASLVNNFFISRHSTHSPLPFSLRCQRGSIWEELEGLCNLENGIESFV